MKAGLESRSPHLDFKQWYTLQCTQMKQAVPIITHLSLLHVWQLFTLGPKPSNDPGFTDPATSETFGCDGTNWNEEIQYRLQLPFFFSFFPLFLFFTSVGCNPTYNLHLVLSRDTICLEGSFYHLSGQKQSYPLLWKLLARTTLPFLNLTLSWG